MTSPDVAALDAPIRTALGLFPSVIKSGEPWTNECCWKGGE